MHVPVTNIRNRVVYGTQAALAVRHRARDIASELQKSTYRNGPLFQLKTTVDTSELKVSGQLIRSDRMARMEAVLLISRGAIPGRKLALHAGLIDAREVQQMVELLNTSYDMTQSAFRVEKTATGYLLMTRPNLVNWLDRLHHRQSQMKLSQPAMETLTIIAYQQPITRVGVEAIRGVQSSEMIRQLIDRSLVKVGGEEDSLGRPFLYVTTRAFLDMFGLGRVEDLPDYDSIGRKPDPAESTPADGLDVNEVDDSDSAMSESSPEQDQQAA